MCIRDRLCTLAFAACGSDSVTDAATTASEVVEDAVDGDDEAFSGEINTGGFDDEEAMMEDDEDAMEDEGDAGDSRDLAAANAENVPTSGDATDQTASDAQPVPDNLTAAEIGRQIIFTANVRVEVDDVAAAGAEASSIIEELGGFVFGQNTIGGANAESTITFKVLPSDFGTCLLYTSPSPRDRTRSRMPSSA